MDENGIRAFSNPTYDYYELQVDLGGIVPKGAIFVHDPDDTVRGSPAEGCLKLCWTPDGKCYRAEGGGICANTVVFHVAFASSPMFKKVESADGYMSKEFREQLTQLKCKLQDDLAEVENALSKFR